MIAGMIVKIENIMIGIVFIYENLSAYRDNILHYPYVYNRY